MPRTNRTYALPAGNPLTTGTTITASQLATNFSDLGAEITNSAVLVAAEAAKTTAYSVVAADAVVMLTNRGAATPITFTLPSASANIGTSFTFHKVNAQNITITAVGTDVVMDSGAAGSISNSTAAETYATLTLKAIPLSGSTYSWMITNGFGTWTTV